METRPSLVERCKSPIVFSDPELLAMPPSWVGHIPFAFWLMEAASPRLLVELGTHTGSSYCAFCQAVKLLQLGTRCYAVDTWKGDPHAGFYEDEIFQELQRFHQDRYADFSALIRSTFDAALEHFQDGTVDILHIDGYHTYEAAKHDFESWLPKLSDRAVVLLHDTNVRERDFGVARYFDELSQQYPTFNFLHSFGLGVVAVGSSVPEQVAELTSSALPPATAHEIRRIFSTLGSAYTDRVELKRVSAESKVYYEQRLQLIEEFTTVHNALEREREHHAREYSAVIAERQAAIGQYQEIEASLRRQLEENARGLEKFEQSHLAQLERIKLESARACRTLEAQHQAAQQQSAREIAELQAALSATTDELHRALGDNQLLRFQLDAVFRSRSWKLSAPVRGAGSLIRSKYLRGLNKAAKAGYWAATGRLGQQIAARRAADEIRRSGLFDVSRYCEQYPELTLIGADPVLHFVLHGARDRKVPHPLFDTAYYLEKNPDVALSGWNPLHHYIRVGHIENRSPHPVFDLRFYLSNPPQVEFDGWNPLYRFMMCGTKDRKSPHRLFDIDYYVGQIPELMDHPLNPLVHYLTRGYLSGLRPHPLFDTEYYLLRYPDVARSGINPLAHFLTQGWREHRNPHPLFDTEYYLQRYGSQLEADEDPLSHFVRIGWQTGCNPNAYFDCRYYLGRYPDIAASGVNPLEHYAGCGWQELRDPSSLFNTDYYLRTNPDVESSGNNPLEHFIGFGIYESREPSPCQLHRIPANREQWKNYLPVAAAPRAAVKLKQPVSVVVPVYRGYSVTRACVESVLRAKTAVDFRLILINDCSPEVQVERYLNELPADSRLEVLHNEENLGFVKTVNKGMALHPKSDVVLLNSDTVVDDYWLDRLAEHAHRDRRIGTVTPCSNNATLCNYPTLKGFTDFLPGQSVRTLNRALYAANAGRAVEIPTAVGFCMYIKRDCLDDIGLFDHQTFGKGYGEENDFCMKASAKGWKHLQACDTFVYHEGEASFQSDSSPSKVAASEIMRRLYPHYEPSIARHCSDDPAAAQRIAGLAADYRLSKKPVILFITHNLQGGTEKHLQDLIRRLSSSARLLVLRPMPYSELGGDVLLEAHDVGQQIHFMQTARGALEFLAEFLPSWGIDRVHVHHTAGYSFPVISLLRRMRIPFDFTAHDYFAICPQIYLTDAEGNYCGEPDAASCASCILDRPSWGAADITAWRQSNKSYIVDAERVICPSDDVRARLSAYYPAANYEVFPHTSGAERHATACLPRLEQAEPLRVAVLGVLAPPKGSRVVAEAAKLASNRELPIEFHLIGFFHGNQDHGASQYMKIHGHYDDAELAQLIAEVDPHLVWFPSRCPETFSYTLSAALDSGRPILAPNLGAFIDRLEDRFAAEQIAWDANAEEVLDRIAEIRSTYYAGYADFSLSAPAAAANGLNGAGAHAPAEPATNELPTTAEYDALYAQRYLEPIAKHPEPKIFDTRNRRGRISVLVLAENSGMRPSPCSYIRVLLPLTHPYCAPDLEVTTVAFDELFAYRADVLILNRVSLADCRQVQEVIAYCRREGIALVYDLDDDLLAIDAHPERHHYTQSQSAIFLLLCSADLVWFSSETLKERFESLCARCEVVFNALDENLWRRPRLSRREAEAADDVPVRILYMGTSTHQPDFEAIEPALRELKTEFGDQVEVEIIGVLEVGQAPQWCRVVTVPPVAGASYPSFVRWLLSRGRYDIGLCPLIDSDFNSAKSEIKFLDYAALGAVPVCSTAKPYRRIVVDGENGLLVDGGPEAWYESLKRLVSDRSLRDSLRRGAENTLRSEYPLMKQAAKRLESLKSLLAETGAVRKSAAIQISVPQFSWQSPENLLDLILRCYCQGETALITGAEWSDQDRWRPDGSGLPLEEIERGGAGNYNCIIAGEAWRNDEDPQRVFSALQNRLAEWGYGIFTFTAQQRDQFFFRLEAENGTAGGSTLRAALKIGLPEKTVVVVQKQPLAHASPDENRVAEIRPPVSVEKPIPPLASNQ